MHAEFITQVNKAARVARKYLKAEYGVNSLLADFVSNPKVMKGMKEVAVATSPLHLAPADLSGFNVCPMASVGCKAACLHTAGNPAYMAAKHTARINRTKAYFGARNDFMIMLAAEIIRDRNKAERLGFEHAVRLNATSDIPWEKVSFEVDGTTYPNLMTSFPETTFYDYTKRHNRRNLPDNYSLTFSLAEDNDGRAFEAVRNGMNLAVVFDTGRNKPLPDNFGLTVGRVSGATMSLPVIDGDIHDFRPADPPGVVVGLRAKGDARHDKSGFVRAA